jgi:hypothetical protein
MNVAFLDFWYDFQPENNFFIHLVKSIKENVNITSPEKADVIFYSCFGDLHKKYNSKKIFFTGENLRPDFNNCDLSLSFDFEDYNNRNIRLPLWYLYIDWFNVKSYKNPDWLIPVEYLSNDNEFTKKDKKQFCSTVFSSPYDSRFNMINLLNTYNSVDCYGKIHNNKLPDGEKYKMDVISNYKFNICFENSVYPGYFTEKLLHAKIAGCIPIYYSDKSYSNDFNTKCCINLIDFENGYELVEYIKKIDNDDNLYQSIKNEKLFNQTPNLDKIKKYLQNEL